MRRQHEIRFGFDFLHHLMNHWQPELGAGPRGSFDFGNAVTSLNTAAIAAGVGFQGGTPSFENGWNGMAGFPLWAPPGSGKSIQVLKKDNPEKVVLLYIFPPRPGPPQNRPAPWRRRRAVPTPAPPP